MTFHPTPPKVQIADRYLNFQEYCGACSDSSGVLQFYTNGANIYDKSNQLMQNGDTLNPGPYWHATEEYGSADPTGAFAVPDPGHANGYYLIHTGIDLQFFADPDTADVIVGPLFYTYIDMNTNAGKGKVVKKNQVLLPGNLTHPAACKHGNGRDWWVMIAERGKPIYHTWLISPAGIEGPFSQTIGPIVSKEYVAQSVFTPDGQSYVRHNSSGGLNIFDFDRCTGLLSNLREVKYPDGYFFTRYAMASPNSRFLYVNDWDTVWSLDLAADDPGVSFDTIIQYDGFVCPLPWQTGIGIPGLGPDGKIYYAAHNSAKCIHVLHQPNLPGWAADFAQHDLPLPRYNEATMCHFPNYRLGIWEGSPCDTMQLVHPPEGFVATKYQAFEAVQRRHEQQGHYSYCVKVGKAVKQHRPSLDSHLLQQALQQRKMTTFKAGNKP